MNAWLQRAVRPLTKWFTPPVEQASSDARKYPIPPRILIFQDNPRWSAFVSFWKLAAIAVPVLTTWNTSWPLWKRDQRQAAINSTIFSSLTIPGINLLTSPYTTNIFLLLPHAARVSPRALEQWLRKVPVMAQLQLQTISWAGRPVMRTHAIDSLRPIPHIPLRIAQYSTVGSRRKAFSPGEHFHVPQRAHASENVKYKGVWPEIAEMIKKQGKW